MSDLTEYAWTDKMMMVADRIDQNHILVRYVLAKDVEQLEAELNAGADICNRLEDKVKELEVQAKCIHHRSSPYKHQWKCDECGAIHDDGKAQQEKVRPSGEIDPPAPRCSPR